MNDNELSTAALRNLPQSVKSGPTVVSFELGYGKIAELNAQREAIEEYRQRLSLVTDTRTRRAYEKWLDFFQRENDKAREEADTGARRRAWLESKARRRLEEARVEQQQQEIEKL